MHSIFNLSRQICEVFATPVIPITQRLYLCCKLQNAFVTVSSATIVAVMHKPALFYVFRQFVVGGKEKKTAISQSASTFRNVAVKTNTIPSKAASLQLPHLCVQ